MAGGEAQFRAGLGVGVQRSLLWEVSLGYLWKFSQRNRLGRKESGDMFIWLVWLCVSGRENWAHGCRDTAWRQEVKL